MMSSTPLTTTDSTATLDSILGKLNKVRRSGDGWMARCPAHEDRDPSLSISEGTDGAVLLHCHAGCTTEAVVAELGVTLEDLFPPRETSPTIVATYDYVDKEGELLYQVVRMSGKQFWQRRPDGAGGYVWNLRGVERRLYHLPQVLEAVSAGRHVFLVEGEKDVHRLEALDFVATTNSGGAGKWYPSMNEALQGAHVVILPDNDEAGEKHAQQVATALSGIATDIRVVELPDLPSKGDVSDWVATGGTAEALKELTKATAEWELGGHDEEPEPVGDVAPEEWEQPLRLDTPAGLPKFPVQVLPPVLRDFVTEVAETVQVPVDMPAVAVLGVLAACTAGRYKVNLSTHTEPCNLYLLCAMEPGERKTQTMKHVTAPLYEEEAALVERAKPEVEEVRAGREIAEARIKRLQTQAAKCDDATERQTMQRELAEIRKSMDDPLPLPRLIVDDATPEALAKLLAENHDTLAMLSAEGGVAGMMAGRYQEHSGPNLDVYLKGHAGDPFKVDRASGETLHLENPALTLSLVVQPEVLRQLAEVKGGKGRGLLGRFLYSLPATNLGRRSNTQPHVMDLGIEHHYAATVSAMLAQPLGDKARVLSIDGAARTEWAKFADAIEHRLREDGDLRPLADWASKAAGAVARIAGCLHSAEHLHSTQDGAPIAPETVKAAVEIVDYFVHHALAAFGVMGDSPAMTLARRVYAWIDRHDQEDFSRAELHQAIRTESSDELIPALRLLEQRSIVREIDQPPRGGVGRPLSPRYIVNPYLRNHSFNSEKPPTPELNELNERSQGSETQHSIEPDRQPTPGGEGGPDLGNRSQNSQNPPASLGSVNSVHGSRGLRNENPSTMTSENEEEAPEGKEGAGEAGESEIRGQI